MTIFKPDFPYWQDAFANAIHRLGVAEPKSDIIADGKIHRFSANGKSSNSSGWYVVFEGEIVSGVVGNWGTNEKLTFIWSERRLTEHERVDISKKWADAQKRAEEARTEVQAEAAIIAQEKWESLSDAPNDHPYAVKKGISTVGARKGKGRLYIPLYDESGNITSLQSIDDKGQKLFLPDGRVKGCYFITHEPKEKLYVAEGYATAMSIQEATTTPCATVFNAGNIKPAIESLRKRFPSIEIIICADSDETGIKHAKEAAEPFAYQVMTPTFKPEHEASNPTDFNDYASLYGMEELKAIFSVPAKQTSKFNLLSFQQVTSLPRTKWLIDGVIPQSSFAVIYGEPAKGKTFVALDMALHVSQGIEWHDCAVKQGNVLYIAGEGLGGLPRRLRAWQYQNSQGEPITNFWAIASNVNMTNDEDVNHVIAAIKSIGQNFQAVFIDTVARALLGGDENSSTDMGLFVAACDRIKHETRATVIGIHHSGKDADRGMRGSSALLGAVDSVIQVNQNSERLITLKNEKQKDGEQFKDKTFRQKLIATSITETSLVLVNTEEVFKEDNNLSPTEKRAYQFLCDCLVDSTRTIRGCPAIGRGEWLNACIRRGLSMGDEASQKNTFKTVARRLAEKNKIAVDDGFIYLLVDKNVQNIK